MTIVKKVEDLIKESKRALSLKEIYEKTSEQCFEEKIEAWDFGPVVPEAYREYKQFGSGDIPSISYIIDFDNEDIWESKAIKYKDNIILKPDKQRMESVVDKFADYSATDLVSIIHAQTPWKAAYKKGQNNEITIDSIKGFFLSYL